MGKRKTAKSSCQYSEKELRNNALKHYEQACDLLIGPGYFHLFSPELRNELVNQRPPALKLKEITPRSAPDSRLEFFSFAFKIGIRQKSIFTLNGQEIPLYLFFREGVTLIYQVYLMDELSDFKSATLKRMFKPYFDLGTTASALDTMLQLLHGFNYVFLDWGAEMYCFNISSMAAFHHKQDCNEVELQIIRPFHKKICIEGHTREIIWVGWPDYYGGVNYVSIEPSKLGLQGNEPLPIFIQKHALQRLQERLSLLPGPVHFSLFNLFMDVEFDCLTKENYCLLALKVMDQKLGYLLCSLHGDVIVIRTFLFLTNDGTPEGQKLQELTKVNRLDKQYLGIDTLKAFLEMNIESNAVLSGLFNEAGCSGLLNTEPLIALRQIDLAAKDPALLLKYLNL
ncbi:hypothetical protein [Desertivirga brevis]|uniref:hypothetical protein n=1 Tax=Desertivirga brevis TaxID=2810310 RepID=UPI001A95A888|nr:hypothetical protein [Pedobacter sp. SYSU D00873]